MGNGEWGMENTDFFDFYKYTSAKRYINDANAEH